MEHFSAQPKPTAPYRMLPHAHAAAIGLVVLMACAPGHAATPEKPAPQTSKAPAQTRSLARQAVAAEQPTLAELEARARAREIGDQTYPYHTQPRKGPAADKCPEIELITYEGSVIAYNQPIEINTHFKDRLVRFERIVAQVAVQVYGRAPTRIIHAGGYSCKSVSGRGKKLSEHAFGHAIDVSGFEFGANPDADPKNPHPGDKAFKVVLLTHWNAQKGPGAAHRQFLHELAEALKQRGPFSVMLGPAYKGHDRFFHFDFGPQFFFRI